MKSSLTARALVAALAVLVAGSALPASAEMRPLHFEVVTKIVKVDPDAEIAVRLVDTKTGRGVPEAVIFATRLDMAPDGMAAMKTRIAALPGSAEGVYRFKANVSMAGHWRLSLAAKVQGEEGTLDNKIELEATE